MRLIGKNKNWGAITAIIALVLVFVFHFAYPMPNGAGPAGSKSIDDLKSERSQKQKEYDSAEARVDELTWDVARDEVAPSAMAWVSKQGLANFVEVNAFRPQRVVEADGLEQMNYLVTAEGPFPNIVSFIEAFGSPGSLLAIKVLQITSITGSDDTVRASLGLVAYQEVESDGQ